MRRPLLFARAARVAGLVACLHLAARSGVAADAVPADRGAPAPGLDEQVLARRTTIPPVPDGSPEELLDYIDGLLDPALLPESRGRQRYHRRRCLANTVEAADRILAQVPPGNPVHGEALRLKFAALDQLERLGEPRAAEALAAFAAQLATGPDEVLAAQARSVAARAEIDALVAAGRLAEAPALIRRVAKLVEAAPDDDALAEAAAGLAAKLARMPGGEAAARQAHETFLPLFENSGNERAGLARRLAGALRLLSLPGHRMPLEGRLLAGGNFDPESLAGKVVLVDFWATWCGPCVAEIANVREAYDQYHDRGFEVIGISLDEDAAALEGFVADRGIPWPVIVDAAAGRGGGQAMADRYGISAIPQCILIGRDGVVISTEARGRRLGELLATEFPARDGAE